MLREEVLMEWNRCKERLLSAYFETKEYKPFLLKLKNAEWKTLAYRVFLFRSRNEEEKYRLNDTISLWEWDNHHKIKPSSIHEGKILTPNEKIVSSWKVLTAKYLVVEEKDKGILEEKILPDSLVQEINQKVKDYQPTEPVEGNRRITWKEEE